MTAVAIVYTANLHLFECFNLPLCDIDINYFNRKKIQNVNCPSS